MLKKFEQFSLNEKEIVSSLGRSPSKFEWQVLKHFYYSDYLSDPISGLSNIVKHGNNFIMGQESWKVAVGLESKGSLIKSSAKQPSSALGVRPGLHYKSKQSKISFGISGKINWLSQSLVGNEDLFFLQDSKALAGVCAAFQKLDAITIKLIDPSMLGNALNTIANQGHGLEIILSSAKQLSILSDKNSQGVLLLIDKQHSNKIKTICRKHQQSCLRLGNLKIVQFISILVRKKSKAHLPIAAFNISELPESSLIPVISNKGKGENLKQVKELKNYSNHVFKLWRVVKKQKWNMFKPQRDAVGSCSLFPGQDDFAVSVPDNFHLLNKNLITGSRIIASNAMRQLVCKGYKPVGAAIIFHGGNIQKNDHLWNLQELFMGVLETCQVMSVEMLRPMITCNNKEHPRVELCIIGKKISKDIIVHSSFRSHNDFITMLGSHRGELNSSRYQHFIQKQDSNQIPAVDLRMDARLQESVLQGIQVGLIKTAANVSNGGLVISLVKALQHAEKGIGARIHLSRKLLQDEMLFGETQGLVVVSIGERDLMEFERICMTIGVPSTTIGRVTSDNQLKFNDVVKIDRKKL